MTRSSRYILALAVIFATLPGLTLAQGHNSEVIIEHTSTAFIKTDVLINDFDILAGGVASAEAGNLMSAVVANDLRLSGLFRVGLFEGDADSLDFEFAIEGTVEGPLRDAEQTGENAPITISLNLLSFPQRQLLMNKRYRPLHQQQRLSADNYVAGYDAA